MNERFNAVPNAGSFNCPVCFRAKSLVQHRREKSLWRCGTERGDGCFAQFRFEPPLSCEAGTLERIREPHEVHRLSIEELAEIHGGRLA